MPPSLRRIPGTATALALLSLLLCALVFTSWWERIEENNFDWLTILTSPGTEDSPVVIVGIDEPSFAEFQRQWPWPRSMHAELIARLKEEGAKVIAFDVAFIEPSTPEADRRLAQAIREAGNVVLAADLDQRADAWVEQQREVLPLQSLLDAGARAGIAKAPLSGACIRRYPEHEHSFGRAILDAAGKHELAPLPPRPMMRYAGPARSFRYVSYYQALQPKQFLPRGFFKDRIVLVGMYLDDTPQLQADMVCTPYSWRNLRRMPGVEINANVIDAAMHDRVVQQMGIGPQLTLLGLLMLLSSFAFRAWSPLRATPRLLALSAGCVLIAWWLFDRTHAWWPLFAPLAGIGGSYLICGGAAFLEERRKRAELRRAFGHYVSGTVIEQMLAHPERLRLGGERREVTLLFSDLAGFTSMSEQLQPEEVAEIMNLYLSEMGAIILARGGTLDKFIGDAVMAFWGAPLDDAEHALHACEAAIAMQEAMQVVNARLATRQVAPLNMRIGIHTGTAVIGNMGSRERFDYTAIGDSVNLASRLEGANKLYGSGILLSAATAARLQGRLPLKHLDRICLKGKREAIEVYTVGDTPLGHDEAIAAFRGRDWDTAEHLWQAHPDKVLAALYLERVAWLHTNPPASDWDGAMVLDAK